MKELSVFKVRGKFDLGGKKNLLFEAPFSDTSLVPIDPGYFRPVPAGRLIKEVPERAGDVLAHLLVGFVLISFLFP